MKLRLWVRTIVRIVVFATVTTATVVLAWHQSPIIPIIAIIGMLWLFIVIAGIALDGVIDSSE